jgi:hypothetical protein
MNKNISRRTGKSRRTRRIGARSNKVNSQNISRSSINREDKNKHKHDQEEQEEQEKEQEATK